MCVSFHPSPNVPTSSDSLANSPTSTQVVSPFQAILDYEKAHNIPIGWVNHAISRSSPAGAWSRLERGEIALSDAFFAQFRSDLTNAALWKEFWAKKGKEAPPAPDIDAKTLFWNMMRISRTPDPRMYPAVKRLRASGRFVMGALSNTVAFPDGIRDEKGVLFEAGLRFEDEPSGGRESRSNGTERNDAEAAHKVEVPVQESKDVRGLFEVFVSSAHVGLRKPDPKIYEFAVQELDKAAREKGMNEGISFQDVLFLDDIGANLRTAKQLGMRTLKVNLGRAVDAVRELEEITEMRLMDDEKSRL